ncbi:MAG: hypothetical protein Q9172_006671 [Xanthocarpia lactea]
MTPLSLDCKQAGPALDRSESVHTISLFHRTVRKRIEVNGDDPIPKSGFAVGARTVTIEVGPALMGGPPMTWDWAIKGVSGLNYILHVDGFKARTCDVRAGVSNMVIGFVKVGPEQIWAHFAVTLTRNVGQNLPVQRFPNEASAADSDNPMPAKLPTRQLGKNGPQVTALGYGAMGLSAFYGAPASDEERFKILDRAYELGVTLWDSADIYMDSEDLIGKWFQRTGKRNDIFIATKFSYRANPDGTREIRSDPPYVREACLKSLSRLGVDCIDLYYCHRVDGITPIEHTVQAMADLRKEGLIKYIGLSEISSETLRRAEKVVHIDAVQIEYSPFTMDIEDPAIGLLATCRELGVAVIAYSPLGRGMITGAYKSPADFEEDDFRRYAPRFSEENFPKNLELVDKLKSIAERKKCTTGQLTLAWLMKQGEDIIPIPGTKKIKYLEENVASVDVVISDEEDKEIRKAVEGAEVHGVRYPPAMASALFADTPPLET